MGQDEKEQYSLWEFQKEKTTESIIKAMMAKIIPNLGREMHIHIHVVQKNPNRLNLNRSATRHVIIFLRVKEKERIVRAAKE